MKLFLSDEKELREPLEVLLKELGHTYEEGGILVTPVFWDKDFLKVEKKGGEATVCCRETAHFFRGIGMILEHPNEDFMKEETVYLDEAGLMLDCSRNGVVNKKTIKAYIRLAAVLGLNQLYLYMEDLYEIPEYPYFGAFRGRYSREELKECDAYGISYGVELIPCVQALAHLETFLRWPENAPLRDNYDNLMPEEESTYELVECMIRSLKHTFRTKKIHLGMDEAHRLGLGAYLKKHGPTERLTIMKRHLAKVEELCRKYDLEPMIWSDMYFNLASEDGSYYTVSGDYEWTEENKPGKDLTMVYWDYYHHEEEPYQRMLHLHKKLTDQICFAAGIWCWNGLAPAYGKGFDTMKNGMKVMKEEGIRRSFTTLWMDDGAETPWITSVLPLIFYAEEAFSEQCSEEAMDRKLKMLGFGSVKDWMLLNRFDCLPGTDETNKKACDPSKALFYQDPLLGLFDGQYAGYDLYGHYGRLAADLREAEKRGGRAQEMFSCYRVLAEFLAVKANLGKDLRKAYLAEDRAWLACIEEEQLAVCLEELETFHEYREKIWFEENKPQGYEVLDIRLGGLRARLKSAGKRIRAYLEGEIEEIPELLEERLPYEKNTDGKVQNPLNLNEWRKIVSAGSAVFM